MLNNIGKCYSVDEVSLKYIIVFQNKLLDYNDYMLPAGVSLLTGLTVPWCVLLLFYLLLCAHFDDAFVK